MHFAIAVVAGDNRKQFKESLISHVIYLASPTSIVCTFFMDGISGVALASHFPIDATIFSGIQETKTAICN